MDHKDHHAGLDTDAGFVQVMNPQAAEAFGQALRKAREDAGITLERAAILTRISPAFIQALESGDFKKLPGVVFARGFVRNLCKPYRKNSTDMLNLFDLAVRQPGEGAASAGLEREEDSAGSEGRARTPFNASRVFAVWTGLSARCQALKPMLVAHKRTIMFNAGGLVLLVLLGIIVANRPEKPVDEEAVADTPVVTEPAASETAEVAEEAPAETTPETPAAAAPLPNDAKSVIAETMVKNQEMAKTAEAVQAPEPAKPVERPAKEQKAAVAPASPNSPIAVGFRSEATNGRQIIEIQAKNQVVVRFSKDGGAFETRTLEPRGHTFEFQDEAQLLVFDAGAVEVKFNGRALGPLGSKGRVRRISFRKEDLGEGKKL